MPALAIDSRSSPLSPKIPSPLRSTEFDRESFATDISTTVTIWGPGAYAGKWLTALGNRMLDVPVYIIIKRRIAFIQRALDQNPTLADVWGSLNNVTIDGEGSLAREIEQDLCVLSDLDHFSARFWFQAREIRLRYLAMRVRRCTLARDDEKLEDALNILSHSFTDTLCTLCDAHQRSGGTRVLRVSVRYLWGLLHCNACPPHGPSGHCVANIASQAFQKRMSDLPERQATLVLALLDVLRRSRTRDAVRYDSGPREHAIIEKIWLKYSTISPKTSIRFAYPPNIGATR